MKIIIEGPDGSGKSTLLNQLSKKLEMETFHPGGPVTSKEDYFIRSNNVLNMLGIKIIDRVPIISQKVYGSLNGNTYLDLLEYNSILSELRSKSPWIIYCTNSNLKNVVKGKHHKPKSQYDLVNNNHEMICKTYSWLMKRMEDRGFKIIEYDWEKETIDDIFTKMDEYFKDLDKLYESQSYGVPDEN